MCIHLILLYYSSRRKFLLFGKKILISVYLYLIQFHSRSSVYAYTYTMIRSQVAMNIQYVHTYVYLYPSPEMELFEWKESAILFQTQGKEVNRIFFHSDVVQLFAMMTTMKTSFGWYFFPTRRKKRDIWFSAVIMLTLWRMPDWWR